MMLLHVLFISSLLGLANGVGVTIRDDQNMLFHPYGSEILGNYNVYKQDGPGGYPAFKHEYFDLYFYYNEINFNFVVGEEVGADTYYAEFGEDYQGVWDIENEFWSYSTTAFYTQFFEEAESPNGPYPTYEKTQLPSRIKLSSSGRLAREYCSTMGIYELTNLECFNRPIWKHKSQDFYLVMTDSGQWVIEFGHSGCNSESIKIVYGSQNYRGIFNPTLVSGQQLWIHAGDDTNDLDKQTEYFEDYLKMKTNPDQYDEFNDCDPNIDNNVPITPLAEIWNIGENQVPTFAESKDQCPEAYCGANAKCTAKETCECKEGYSGVPYSWGGGCKPDPCSDFPCGDFATCIVTQDIEYECVCPEGDNYLPDPDDPKGCILNPCAGAIGESCQPDFEEDTCTCDRDETVSPPAGANPIDGFYGPWTEWSDCPLDCRLNRIDLPMRSTRRRQCFPPTSQEGLDCDHEGPAVEEKSCGDKLCDTPPTWGRWAYWETCSSVCKEEGKGVQIRRRQCLESDVSEKTCTTDRPLGPSIEKRECLIDFMSCPAENKYGAWGGWGSCDRSCNSRDGLEVGVQTRSRSCEGPSCGSLELGLLDQFRICPDMPLCPGNPCHDDWWKDNLDGKYHFGCSDTTGSGIYWCPKPGGVDENSVAIRSKIHSCTSMEISLRRNTRSSSKDKDLCPPNILKSCKNPEEDQKEYCDGMKLMYEGGRELKKTEDIGFVKSMQDLVGWDPLNKDDSSYRNPYVKYEFYQHVLSKFDIVARDCDRDEVDPYDNHRKAGSQCSTPTKCSKISTGKDTFQSEQKTTFRKLFRLADEIDDLAKGFAAAKIATAAVSGTCGAVAVVAIVVAPCTGGASLAAVGPAMACSAATAVISLGSYFAENGLTNPKLKKIRKAHEKTAWCTSTVHKLAVAYEEATEQVRKYMNDDEWEKTFDKLSEMQDVKIQEDLERMVKAYAEASKYEDNAEVQEIIEQYKARYNPEEADKTFSPGGIVEVKIPTIKGQEKHNLNHRRNKTLAIKAKKLVQTFADKMLDCGPEVKESKLSGKKYGFTSKKSVIACVLGADLMTNLIAFLGVSYEEVEAITYIADTKKLWKIYTAPGKSEKTVLKNDLKIAYGDQYNDEIADIYHKKPVNAEDVAKNLNLDVDEVKRAQELKIDKWGRYGVDEKKFRKLGMMGRMHQKIYGSKGYKLYKSMREWVRAKKELAIFKVRKAIRPIHSPVTNKLKSAGKATKTALKGTKAGKKLATLNAKWVLKTHGKNFDKFVNIGVKTLGKAASKIGMGLLDVGFAVWDIIDGVEALKGHSEAMEIRKAGKELKKATKILVDFYDAASDRCEESSSPETCKFTEWSGWGECFHSNGPGTRKSGEECTDKFQVRKRDYVFGSSSRDASKCKSRTTVQYRVCFRTGFDSGSIRDPIQGQGWLKVSGDVCQVDGVYKIYSTHDGAPVYTHDFDERVTDSWVDKDRKDYLGELIYSKDFRTWIFGSIYKNATAIRTRGLARSLPTDEKCPVDNPKIKWETQIPGEPIKLEPSFQITCIAGGCCDTDQFNGK